MTPVVVPEKRMTFLDLGDMSKLSNEELIVAFLQTLLSEWEIDLFLSSDEEKNSTSWKQNYRNLLESKQHLKPLLEKLKRKEIAATIIFHLRKIAEFCQKGEYTKATDWYVKLSIGNAPWPIGVTSVGIHERTHREKIESSKVAHVMNDDQQRKYLTSVKRLMTFCEKRFGN